MDSSSDPATQNPNPSDDVPADVSGNAPVNVYWSGSLRIVIGILSIWAFISLGCGILLREFLDASMPKIGGAPFGFWMAQQGAIIGFLVLLVAYMLLMNGLDRHHGYNEGNDE